MTFQPGKSGNPKGRPKGLRDRRTAYRKMLEPYAPELIRTLIEQALEGDQQALRVCIERLIPKAKESPITFDLDTTTLNTPHAVRRALAAVIAGITEGKLLPSEGQSLIKGLEAQRQCIESDELAHRIAMIENMLCKRR